MAEKEKKKREPKEEKSLDLKKDRKKENKILKIVLLFIGIFFLVLIISFVVMRNSSHPKYGGLTFNAVQQGQILFYHTTFPVIYKGNISEYNIYLRNSPKDLKKEVPFKGEIGSITNTVINITKEFDCNGDQVIAIANMVNLYGAIGNKLIRDENASCDPSGRYTYIVVQPGEKTSVEQVGPSCYNINIKDCEILKGTERYILEMLAKVHSDIYS
jgi:hypothetical protein